MACEECLDCGRWVSHRAGGLNKHGQCPQCAEKFPVVATAPAQRTECSDRGSCKYNRKYLSFNEIKKWPSPGGRIAMTDDLMSSSTWYFSVMLLAGLLMMACMIIGMVVFPVVKGVSMLKGDS